MGVSKELVKTVSYSISIRLSTDGFYFVVTDAKDSARRVCRRWEVNRQRSMAANVKAFLADNEELRRHYHQTDIVVHSPRYTVMPLALYEDGHDEDVFYLNLTRMSNENVLCNVLGKSGLVVLFSIDKLTHQFIIDNFPSARIFASVSPQLEEWSARCKEDSGSNCLFANIHPESMDVICFCEGHLQLVNSYASATVDDRCYYIAGIWSRLGLDSRNDKLCLAGDKALCEEVSGVMKEWTGEASLEDGDIPFDLESLITYK